MQTFVNAIKEVVLFLMDLFGKRKERTEKGDRQGGLVINIVRGNFYQTTDHSTFAGAGSPVKALAETTQNEQEEK